ncbi:MAG: lytic transglycosylase domain-containing protein [Acidobacteriota bacterium]
MIKRRALTLALAVAAVVILIAALLVRQRVRRHRVFRTVPAEKAVAAPPATLSSDRFRALEASGKWGELADLLAQIEKERPADYAKWSLGYLHARALIEDDEPRAAAAKLAPFLAPGNAFRDLALFHQSEIDDSSATRRKLIFEYPHALYRDQAIDEEVEQLHDPRALADFAARLMPAADTARRRDLTARMVEAGDVARGFPLGVTLLKGGTTDDAADRVARALDRPERLRGMTAEQFTLLGDALQNHRHFDRAVAVLSLALSRSAGVSPAGQAASRRPGSGTLPSQPAGTPALRRDQLLFDIGRSYFGDEEYAQAQQTYVRGAGATRDPKWKATFLFHASRAAQLQGNDAGAEQFMTAAIAVPGRFPATSAALTQRLRTRLKQKRFAAAAADLEMLRKQFPKDHALVDGSIAYAIGNPRATLVTLNAIPRPLLDKYDAYEIDYWRARALEAANPPAAFAAYLNVLRAPVPTHFAYFARKRLDAPAMQARLQQELVTRNAEVEKQIAAGNWDLARRIETDRYLLAPRDARRLAEIYRHVPAYAAVIDRKPQPFPSFPLQSTDRAELLMAMGLFDEAVDDLPKGYDLLTKSFALNRGSASRESIYAVEVMMNSVPRDYVPQLLPLVVRQLLYPRYFYDAIVEDAKKYGADPALVLSIMREESRFNPRAKSEAAARGLLQFIITTARQIGREVGIVDVSPEDLYDPRVIIRLGAKYISTLGGQLGGNHYAVAAAYNAGPHQVALWTRLAPAPGDDYLFTSINFDETKHYVRKVMNSYERYEEIYGGAGAAGGMRVEP